MADIIPFPKKEEPKLVLYTRPTCSQCTQAKSFLQTKNIEYIEENIDVKKTELLKKYPSLRILPVVEYDGVVIGSLKELKELYENGRLEK